ncbi:FAD/NAD(P)-binding domain-containing protein [Panus rudis PR-1116 ss-1]|nr:FAD/NAD(P)-binding domain-containing protein [Panus rudis PR-1116 ss-1]
MSPLMKAFVHKTVAVLGASYGGCRAAQILAQQLPSDWRVVLIDRNSHMNHLYSLPRFAVIPGHEHKAFIPYTHLFVPPKEDAGKQENQEETSDAQSATSPDLSRHLILHAQVTSLQPNSLTLSRSFPEYGIDHTLHFDFMVYALGSHLPAPIDLWGPVGDEANTEKENNSTETISSVHTASSTNDSPSSSPSSLSPSSDLSTRVDNPEHLAQRMAQVSMNDNPHTKPVQDILPPGSKAAAIQWLTRFRARIERAPSVLVVGGGALGIQYATDIAEVFPNKPVTLLHSRDQLLPKFDERMHDEILETMQSLNVTTILGERLDLSWPGKTVINEKGESERIVRTLSGREVRAGMILLCTGQKPNTGLIEEFLPDCIAKEGPSYGYTHVKRSLQVAVPASEAHKYPSPAPPSHLESSPEKNDNEEKEAGQEETQPELEDDPNLVVPYPHIFAIGDAADAFGAIKAGHNAFWQGETAGRNVVRLIKGDDKLEKYNPGPPAIKVSVGLNKAIFQINGVVGTKSDVSEDLDTGLMWKFYNIDADEQMMRTM